MGTLLGETTLSPRSEPPGVGTGYRTESRRDKPRSVTVGRQPPLRGLRERVLAHLGSRTSQGHVRDTSAWGHVRDASVRFLNTLECLLSEQIGRFHPGLTSPRRCNWGLRRKNGLGPAWMHEGMRSATEKDERAESRRFE